VGVVSSSSFNRATGQQRRGGQTREEEAVCVCVCVCVCGHEDMNPACTPVNRAPLVTPHCSIHNRRGYKGEIFRWPFSLLSQEADKIT